MRINATNKFLDPQVQSKAQEPYYTLTLVSPLLFFSPTIPSFPHSPPALWSPEPPTLQLTLDWFLNHFHVYLCSDHLLLVSFSDFCFSKIFHLIQISDITHIYFNLHTQKESDQIIEKQIREGIKKYHTAPPFEPPILSFLNW